MDKDLEDIFSDDKDMNLSGQDDETFRLEKLDEYPGELPVEKANESNFNEPEKLYKTQNDIVTSEKTIDPIIKKNGNMKKALLYASIIALLIMFSAITYDWGVNRGGFNDIASIGNSRDTEIIQKRVVKEEAITEDLPEYDESEYSKSETTAPETEPIEKITIYDDKESKDYHAGTEKIPAPAKQKQIKKPAVPKESEDIDDNSGNKNLDANENKDFADNATDRMRKSDAQSEGQAYVVQVYATPSKEDAESWLRKLESKNIGNVFISTQKIRDIEWYRVRFGSFKSEEEARKAALHLGFAQSWIDRVK